MDTLRNLLSLPIYTIETGRKIGQVQDVVVDIDNLAVRGITIDNYEWFTKEGFIWFSDIVSLGRDAVMIKNSNAISAKQLSLPSWYYLNDLHDKEIVTEFGLQIGILHDIIYNPVTGEIRAYQISEGLITDLFYGLKIMPMPPAQVIGKETLIVPEKMKELLQDELYPM